MICEAPYIENRLEVGEQRRTKIVVAAKGLMCICWGDVGKPLEATGEKKYVESWLLKNAQELLRRRVLK